MQPLSSSDGSADAVRAAADSAVARDDNRLALERELDRLNTAVQGSAAALGQHQSWTLVSQAFLLMAYVVVLVGAWSLPLPGKRWLLVGIAGFALAAVVCTYLGLRAARDRVGPLKLQRRRVEDALERVAARPPAFARQGAFTALLAQASTRGLPLLIVAGWIALTLYALGLPMPNVGETRSEARNAPTADVRSAPAAVPVTPPANARAAPRTTPANATGSAAASNAAATSPSAAEPAKAEQPAEAPPSADSPLLQFFRRAANTPPAAEQDVVKP